jgi:hypothetical protein
MRKSEKKEDFVMRFEVMGLMEHFAIGAAFGK